ncbi:hypothetical protein [Labrys neptuniae]
MICTAFTILRFIPPRLLFGVVAIVLALVGILIFLKRMESAAVQSTVSKIERANDAANQKADNAEADIGRRFDDCRRDGGAWDRAQRMCIAPAHSSAVRRDPR